MNNLNYTPGNHYKDMYLTVDNDVNKCTTRTTYVKKTNYGYIFHRFNTYITVFYGKLYINNDGTAKAVVRVERNYCKPYQFTVYFDQYGLEIKHESNNTRKELSIYKQIRKNLQK